jgi:hypothetical protein
MLAKVWKWSIGLRLEEVKLQVGMELFFLHGPFRWGAVSYYKSGGKWQWYSTGAQ